MDGLAAAFVGIGASAPVADVVARLCAVAGVLADRIARGGIAEDLGTARGTNSDGDGQKALDVIADEAFAGALAGSAVRFYASEEQEEAVTINAAGTLALAIDPLDGSSNISTNVSVGTIFGISPAEATAEASFLRPGADLLAGGYVIFGPQCALVVTFGAGTFTFVRDPATGDFVPVGAALRIPARAKEYAINASNARHWEAPVRAYVTDCEAGAAGPLGVDMNMRWVGSLVAEAHRILSRGGVFLYPGDGRKGYERGRLRMVYECAPVAFVITQAGGAATDGVDEIAALVPEGLHARVPLVFGSAEMVADVRGYFAR